MRERRRDYELLFIISPLRSSEEDIGNAIDRVRQAINAAGGEVTNVDQSAPWGRRKFAYPIREYAEGEASRRPFNEGYYVLFHLALPTTQIPTIERSLKLNDAVLRYLLTLIETKGQASAAPAVATAGGAVPVVVNTIEDDEPDVADDTDELDDDESADEDEDDEAAE
jgi:small subunit ribosomal protein S6